MSGQKLSEREQQVLEHLQKAKELDVTVAEYARTFDLNLQWLYSVRKVLVRKGVVPGRDAVDAGDESKPEDFVAVELEAPKELPAPSQLVCRIHHPSGLVIECTHLPAAKWIAALVGCIADVPA